MNDFCHVPCRMQIMWATEVILLKGYCVACNLKLYELPEYLLLWTFKQHFLFPYLAHVGCEILFANHLFQNGDNGRFWGYENIIFFGLTFKSPCIVNDSKV